MRWHLMMKLLIMSVTYNMPQSRASDTITHVTLNIVNNVVLVNLWLTSLPMPSYHQKLP